MVNFRGFFQYPGRNSGSAVSTSEQESFLHQGEFKTKARTSENTVIPWMASTFILGVCLLVVLLMDYPLLRRESYESGYSTEMQAATNEIEIEEVRFWGGIKADENGTFYMHFNPDEKVRYVGKPTREMDEAWDRLAGNFIPLTKEESESINGDISEYKGSYLAATTVQHSLHCLNYLRQAIYDDYYPTIHTIRPHIPEYWLHVDHCVETLRQVIQCGGDLTPVPKIWNEAAGQLLADIELVHTCRKFDRILEWSESR